MSVWWQHKKRYDFGKSTRSGARSFKDLNGDHLLIKSVEIHFQKRDKCQSSYDVVALKHQKHIPVDSQIRIVTIDNQTKHFFSLIDFTALATEQSFDFQIVHFYWICCKFEYGVENWPPFMKRILKSSEWNHFWDQIIKTNRLFLSPQIPFQILSISVISYIETMYGLLRQLRVGRILKVQLNSVVLHERITTAILASSLEGNKKVS